MAIMKLKFDDSFYDEEIRCGYLVSKEMKKVWAVCLDLLNEFIRVCEENHIDYYLMYGSLLGAIRHKGFIPWDDDIDIVMDRKNYAKLCSIAESEFKYPYFFQNDYTDFGFTRGFSRLRNSSTTAIQNYEKDAGVPYNQGIWIDIFPMDNMPNNKEERIKFGNRVHKLHGLMWNNSYKNIRFAPQKNGSLFSQFKNIYYTQRKKLFLRRKRINKYRELIECESQKYNDIDTEFFYVVYGYTNTDKELVFTKSEFEKTLSVQFEMLNVKIPACYEEILTCLYGDWKEFVIGANTHGDVIFDPDTPYIEYVKEKEGLRANQK